MDFGLDAAAKAGLTPVGLEPDIGGMFKDGHGFQLIRSEIGSLSQKDRDSLAKYMSGDQGARADLEKNMSGTAEQKKEFFNDLDKMRTSHPPLDVDRFKAALRVDDPASRATMISNTLQDYRTDTWAANIQKVQSEDPNARTVVFAGALHFDKQLPNLPPPPKPGQPPAPEQPLPTGPDKDLFDVIRGAKYYEPGQRH